MPAQSPALFIQSILIGSVIFQLLCTDTSLEEMDSQYREEMKKIGTWASSLGVQNHLRMTAGSLHATTFTDFIVVF